MKKFLIQGFVFFFATTFLFGQTTTVGGPLAGLQLPNGTKFYVLTEDPRDSSIISKQEIESAVKLTLRKNKVPYAATKAPDDNRQKTPAYLYVNVNASKSLRDHYGNISIEFVRNGVHYIVFSDILERKDLFETLAKKGHQRLYGVTVWHRASIFFNPERYNHREYIVSNVKRLVDEFSIAFLEANGL